MHAGTLLFADRTPVGGRRTRLGSSVDPVPPVGLGVPPDWLVSSLLEPGAWVRPLTLSLHPDLGSAAMPGAAQGGPA